ncbi:MAG TPA: zinc ribbon domain-containing protein, partial [Solirubrobacteraceae bacterium]|nr:zinc ribbon domain-containing protein [Solirubrobacteraceae bacterium]
MPIYEYRRPDGTTFEIQQSFSEEPLTVDPDTGVPVERVLHPPAVHFKGKGFYNTDYGTRSRQRETAAAAAGEKSSSEGSSTEKKTAPDSGSSSSGNGAGKSSEAKSVAATASPKGEK